MNWRNLFICIALLFVSISFSSAIRKYESPSYALELAEVLSNRFGLQITAEDNIELYDTITRWLGTPHRMGQSTKKGTDCSGFVTNIYKSVYGKKLERSSAGMLSVNCEKVDKENLCEGDLVFFYTSKRSQRPSHVGVYLKNGKFAHSSTSNGVIVSSLNEPYYAKRWISGGVVK